MRQWMETESLMMGRCMVQWQLTQKPSRQLVCLPNSWWRVKWELLYNWFQRAAMGSHSNWRASSILALFLKQFGNCLSRNTPQINHQYIHSSSHQILQRLNPTLFFLKRLMDHSSTALPSKWMVQLIQAGICWLVWCHNFNCQMNVFQLVWPQGNICACCLSSHCPRQMSWTTINQRWRDSLPDHWQSNCMHLQSGVTFKMQLAFSKFVLDMLLVGKLLSMLCTKLLILQILMSSFSLMHYWIGKQQFEAFTNFVMLSSKF